MSVIQLFLFFVMMLNGAEAKKHVEVRSRSQSQTHTKERTGYHFQARNNWLNDPNGPMYYNGVYHLFYQYNPDGAVFDGGKTIIWAHSVSYDLINWIPLQPALSPSEPYDINGCWSGSATIFPPNKPVILYTGINSNGQQVQNLARPKNLSDPFLQEWIKFPKNPLIVPPKNVYVTGFRDPTTAWQGRDRIWRILVGGLTIDGIGMAVLYKSKDFINWTKYPKPLYSSSKTSMWECPDFYPVVINSTNGVDTSVLNPLVKHVLKASFKRNDYYVIGSYDLKKEKFVPESPFTGTSSDLMFDYGVFYASKTFFDGSKSRRILWGWVPEADTIKANILKGWAGLQTIPRQVWLDKTGKRLVQWPVEELKTLRGKQVSLYNKKLRKGSVFEVSGITASQADVEVVFELPALDGVESLKPGKVDPQKLCDRKNASVKGRVGPFGLITLATEDLSEQTAIFFRIFRTRDRYSVLMCSDPSRSSLKTDTIKTTHGAFVDIDPLHESISLKTLIDHSIVESFGGEGKTCMTTRVYPQLALDDKAKLFVFNNGTTDVAIKSLHAWNMNKAQINK